MQHKGRGEARGELSMASAVEAIDCDEDDFGGDQFSGQRQSIPAGEGKVEEVPLARSQSTVDAPQRLSTQKRPRDESEVVVIDVDDDDGAERGKELGAVHTPRVLVRPRQPAEEIIDDDGLALFVPHRRASMFTAKLPSPIAAARKQRLAERQVVLRALPRDRQIEDDGSRFSAIVVSRPLREELTLEDVKDAVAEIGSDNDIGRAAHTGIYACRLQSAPQGRILEFTDDDGEQFAAAKILAVLRTYKLCNVAVVVVRWFGGKLLGPRRFVHISNVTERILTLGKFCE